MNDGEIKLQVILDDKSSTKSLDTLGTKANKVQSSIVNVGKKIGSALVNAVKITGVAITGMIAYGVKYNAEIEQLQTSFEVMTGSAEKATEVVQKLKDVGAKTPYDLKGLAKTTQTLMQYGLTADEAYEATLNFGDIAQGSAEKMQGIALAYGQMSSAGKLNMQDIKQMINQGFNPLRAVADMTGETMQQVTARYEENKISVDEVTKAMQYASSEQGKYYQSMEKQSKTLNGQVSTLKENFASLSGIMAKDTTNAISGKLLPAINDLMSGATKIIEEEGFAGLFDKLPDLIEPFLNELVNMISTGLPKIISVVVSLFPKLIEIIAANLPLLVASIVDLIPQIVDGLLAMLPMLMETGIDIFIQLVEAIATMLPTIIPQIIDAILGLIPILMDNMPLLMSAGSDILFAIVDGLINSIPSLVEQAPVLIQFLIQAIMSNFGVVTGTAIKLVWALISGLIKAIPSIMANTPKLVMAIINGLKNGLSGLWEIGKNVVKGLWEGISGSFTWIKNKLKGWVGDVLNFVKKIFGIASPSKEFAVIGKYNVEGMMSGIDKMEGKLDKQLSGTFGSMLNPSFATNNNIKSNPNIYLTLNNDMKTDNLGQLVNNIKTFASGSKVSYNGG